MGIVWKLCSARTWVAHMAVKIYNGAVQQNSPMNSSLAEQKLSVRAIHLPMTLTFLEVELYTKILILFRVLWS